MNEVCVESHMFSRFIQQAHEVPRMVLQLQTRIFPLQYEYPYL